MAFAILPPLRSINCLSTPLHGYDTDECGLPTGADAPQCDERGFLEVEIEPITNLSCNFTLSTTIQNITLQYGLREFYKTESGTIFTSARFGAPATFFGLKDDMLSVYSPLVPRSESNIDTGDAVDTIYKLWLYAPNERNPINEVTITPYYPDPDDPKLKNSGS